MIAVAGHLAARTGASLYQLLSDLASGQRSGLRVQELCARACCSISATSMQECLRQSLRPRHGHQPNPARCQGSVRLQRSPELTANVVRQATGATASTSAQVSTGSRAAAASALLSATQRLLLNLQETRRQAPPQWYTNGAAATQPAEALQRPSPLEDAPDSQPHTDRELSLYYSSGWLQPTLHCSVAGGQWQDVPLHAVRTCCAGWACARTPWC